MEALKIWKDLQYGDIQNMKAKMFGACLEQFLSMSVMRTLGVFSLCSHLTSLLVPIFLFSIFGILINLLFIILRHPYKLQKLSFSFFLNLFLVLFFFGSLLNPCLPVYVFCLSFAIVYCRCFLLHFHLTD